MPFNGGALKNIGYDLCKEDCDYVCFQDVDILPINSDYSWAETPTVVAKHGFMIQASVPNQNQKKKAETLGHLGGIVLLKMANFSMANGYPNDYWGWGFEDLDLQKRLEGNGLQIDCREGGFETLEHQHRGKDLNGNLNANGLLNFNQFMRRWSGQTIDKEGSMASGLSNLSYDIVKREPLANQTMYRAADWEIVTVSLNDEPSQAHLESLAKDQKKRESKSPPSPKSFTGSQFS